MQTPVFAIARGCRAGHAGSFFCLAHTVHATRGGQGGAFIPNAAVSIVNTGTNVESRATTDAITFWPIAGEAVRNVIPWRARIGTALAVCT